MKKYAILSVTDKTNLEKLGKKLLESNFMIFSSGGTKKYLEKHGIKVSSVSELTGFPEILDGRVKTLHPKVFGGILGDCSNESHLDQMEENKIKKIDLVVVNFYNFDQGKNKTFSEAIESIDIGGPSMVRAAAKNHKNCLVVTDPKDYEEVINNLDKKFDSEMRKKYAAKAFSKTAKLDLDISRWMDDTDQEMNFIFSGKWEELRYGENPHQKAAVLISEKFKKEQIQHQGKALSYNNYLDMDAALRLCKSLPSDGSVVVKHTNPTGVALNKNLRQSMEDAWNGDPRAAFGSVIAIKPKLDRETAEYLSNFFVEVIIAPEVEEEALEILEKKKNLRVLTVPFIEQEKWSLKTLSGGITLCQHNDKESTSPKNWSWHGPEAMKKTIDDLYLANLIVKEMKSNAICLVKNGIMVGGGAGSTSRVGALEIALSISKEKAKGSVMSSDAFFPFRDSIDLASSHGIIGIVQPGGSIKDEEVIKASIENKLSLALTGRRHFNH
tara:strand:- start:1721 stop:3211 length:1491 start_codon:yes stop_codon:yes gene_type:complete